MIIGWWAILLRMTFCVKIKEIGFLEQSGYSSAAGLLRVLIGVNTNENCFLFGLP